MLKGLMKIFLVRIINHVMVYTHKKFDDSEMVWESCKTKLIWLKLEELEKNRAELTQKLQNLKSLV